MSIRQTPPGDKGRGPPPRGPRPPRKGDEETTSVIEKASDEFSTALLAVHDKPADLAGWDRLEDAARGSRQIAPVAALYREVLKRELPVPLLLDLGERAVRFYDEWLDEPKEVVDILARLLELDPALTWAFDRISLNLTALARWDQLLALYDRALTACEPSRRRSLLEEAAHVAKDCAGQVDRAIAYLQRLFEMDRSDVEIVSSLERLLTQQARHVDLIELWTRRVDVVDPADRIRLRQRIARSRLENLGDAPGALVLLEPLLADEAGADGACALLQTILEAPSTDPATRHRVLDLLRGYHDAAGRWTEVVRVLRTALPFAEGRERIEIHAEIARRLVEHEQEDEALGDLAALLVLDAEGCDDAMLGRLLAKKFKGEIAGCKPHIDRDRGRALLHRAAEMATGTLGARDRGVHLYRTLLEDAPDDLAAVARLAALYADPGQEAELLAVRKHELGVVSDTPRRLELRLEIARLHGVLGNTGAAIEILRESLAEQPDHRTSIDTLVAALEAAGGSEALYELLATHAAKLEGLGSSAPAAELWAKAAKVAEGKLDEPRRAIECLQRVAAIAPDHWVLDGLARLHGALGEHLVAVSWLEKRVAATPVAERTASVAELAGAHERAGQPEQALACLERGLEQAPDALVLRRLQVALLRGTRNGEALVAALIEGAGYGDTDVQREFLREAGDVLAGELKAPERAVAILERVVGLGDADLAVRARLADVLRRVGRLDEARELAEALIAEFRGRRHPERAAIHMMLARILRAMSDDAAALQQLEQAVGMDMGNAGAQRMLADLCRDAGQLERAERAYQALLLVQKRETPHGRTSGYGVSETLFELYRVAAQLGEEQRANENLASAFDTARRSSHEASRLERVLRKARRPDLLLRALEQRLATATDAPTRGAALTEIAEILESLGRHEEALERALGALPLQPESEGLLDRARALSVRAGQAERLTTILHAMIEAALAAGHGALGCRLLLVLGDVLENDLARLDDAAAAYDRGEDTGENLDDVWRHKARLASKRGDRGTRLAALRKLADLTGDQGLTAERTETLYALADDELQAGETLEGGLATLALAIEAEPRYGKAAELLRKALRVAVDREPVVRLYETIARSSGDEATILDALVAAISLPIRHQEPLQEGFALATRLQAAEQGTRILERAVEVADGAGEPSEALWAMRHLADESEQRGDLVAAIRWMTRAADVSVTTDAFGLRMRIAALAAGPAHDLELARRTYEQLCERDPDEPEPWQRLLDVLRTLGDPAQLERALDRAVEVVHDPVERDRLRMERVRLLLQWPERAGDARSVLESVLEEEPEHQDATHLLADLLARTGDRTALAELLTRQLDAARDRKDVAAGVTLALRLGGLLAEKAAIDLYRSVLEWEPGSVAILRALVGLLSPTEDASERADLVERLVASETGPARLEAVISLIEARRAMDDVAGLERALESAWQIDPDHAGIREEMRKLAHATLVEIAEHPEDRNALSYKAAALLHDRLGDTAGALDALESAADDDPHVLNLRVRCLVETGRGDAAGTLVSDAIDAVPPDDALLVDLLQLRAFVLAASEDHESAVADLEQALVIADETQQERDALLANLHQALGLARHAAVARGDGPAERPLALRQAELLLIAADADGARAILAGWVQTAPDDVEAIHRLLVLDTDAQRLDDVAEGYRRLLDLETGAALVEVALKLAEVCETAGKPEQGRQGLERVYQADPANPTVRGRLRALYTSLGAHRELASLMLIEAKHTTDEARRFELLRDAGRLRLERLDDPITAVGPLSEAMELRPTDHDLTLLMAQAYTSAGMVQEAVDLLEAAISRRSGRRSRELATLQHRMSSVAGTRQSQLQWLYAAFETDPKNPEICAELTDLATELKDYETALKALRVLVSMKELSTLVRGTAYLKQAQIALLQGDDKKALFLAKKAQSEDGGIAEAQELVERLGGRR